MGKPRATELQRLNFMIMVNQQCPKHDRPHFFKYTSANAARLILQNRTLKYSSPLLFNDPFDVQTEFVFDFDIDTLQGLILKEIEEIIRKKTTVNLSTDNEWAKAILLLKDKVKQYGYCKKLVTKIFTPFLKKLAELTEATRKEYNNKWQNNILPRMRVLSLSEGNDMILMWSHYAREQNDNRGHTGVVLKLNVLPDEYNSEGNNFCVAKPMRYKEDPPPFYSAKDWVEEHLGIKTVDLEALYFEYAYAKNAVWKYEKEWRVWDLLPESETELYSFYPIKPQEISTIYFGINTAKPDQEDIMDLAKAFNPKMRFYKARKAVGGYKLDFFEITFNTAQHPIKRTS